MSTKKNHRQVRWFLKFFTIYKDLKNVVNLFTNKEVFMEFRQQQLKDILTAQTKDVDLFDQNGIFRKRVSGVEAATLVGASGFVGVGNKKRIRFVKPEKTNANRKPSESLGTGNLLKAWEKEPKKKITQGGLVNPK